jgi:Uma2 family endonuclease
MAMPELKRRWTVAERDQLPDDGNRYEVIDGEVLSASTARVDRVEKRKLYREEHVPEYWIVDLDSRTFERSIPTDDRPEILVDQLLWNPEGSSEPLVIDVPDYFEAVLERSPRGFAANSTRSGWSASSREG